MSNEWTQSLQSAQEKSDFDERQAKIDRISSDPKPYYAPPVKKPYVTTEPHYIMVVDEEWANLSLPEAEELYNEPHKLGNLLLSDRKEVPHGWIKTPQKGTSIDAIKDEYPGVYEVLVEKKVTNF